MVVNWSWSIRLVLVDEPVVVEVTVAGVLVVLVVDGM